jgi:branched-chain amino acid transport system ATP-binding protein
MRGQSKSGALSVRNVTMRFGGHLALDDVHLDAMPGQVTGLIGPNGAGKTTLFNVITGLLTPQRGAVRLDGVGLNRLSPHRRARHGLARTFQRLELFGLLTVRENVELADALRRGSHQGSRVEGKVGLVDVVRSRLRQSGRADALLEKVGLADLADTRADELSTGRARLLELARALATRPRVLLLDEPASGLDDRETEALGTLLAEIADGQVGDGDPVAVVLVEHDVQLVMRACHRIHVLDFGKVICVGTPDEVQCDQAVLDAYLGAGTATAAVATPPPTEWGFAQ